MKKVESLKDWYIVYIKHKDIFDKRIRDIEDNSDTVYVKYKDSSLTAIIRPEMQDVHSVVKNIKECESPVHLVMYNKKNNLDAVLEAWSELAECKNLKVIFANPEASGDHKWIIVPHTHDKITPPSSLKSGLESLFQTVEEVQ